MIQRVEGIFRAQSQFPNESSRSFLWTGVKGVLRGNMKCGGSMRVHIPSQKGSSHYSPTDSQWRHVFRRLAEYCPKKDRDPSTDVPDCVRNCSPVRLPSRTKRVTWIGYEQSIILGCHSRPVSQTFFCFCFLFWDMYPLWSDACP